MSSPRSWAYALQGPAGAEKLMPTSLELGGKSPTIVCADADLDHAVAGVLYGIFSSSGESCIAGSRLFVARPINADFMQRLVAGARALRVGDPASERTQMGPLITPAHRAGIERFVALGLSEGGRLLCRQPAADECGHRAQGHEGQGARP